MKKILYYFFLFLYLTLISTRSTLAFDYLEHSYFTDKACYKTQVALIEKGLNRDILPIYLALALYCPSSWKRNYCDKGYKIVEGNINALSSKPENSGDYSLTLGDISALPDHTDHYGALKNIPNLKKEGLLSQVLEWISEEESDADGFIEDIAEDACETDELTSWKEVEQSLQQFQNQKINQSYFKTGARGEILQGPSDPPGKYSFDNPQYLDMILKNHHHFGEKAYQTWLGLHQAAIDLSQKSCQEILISEHSCSDFYSFLKRRINRWKKMSSPKLVLPVEKYLQSLDESTLDKVFSSLVGLTFEGLGLHFLQDNMAGGHIRTNREALNLEDARYYHDLDGKVGVLAQFITNKKVIPFWAYGDGFLLGKGAGEKFNCPSKKTKSKHEITQCLLQYQRGLLFKTTTASLLHFATQGKLIAPYLSMGSVILASDTNKKSNLPPGTLPLPRPEFSYQSVGIEGGINNKGDILQNGVNLKFLSALGQNANWLTSYNFNLIQSYGDKNGKSFQRFHTGFSFGFHWRWAARFLINTAPHIQLGKTKLGSEKNTSIKIGPQIGITLLPEGWIRLPLDISLNWKLPFTVYKSNKNLISNQQWFTISIGFAFM